ncbi:unnamed protein product [Didymodactylos carnosus]|uniref:Transmembrane protein 208 n=1 Tax=Didymodactylos carnosus TaxID=1234261 RepID=A0A813PV77_9BILA|nr:unnamed protein product [Didymodactylos carnosus]CAF3536866.1 unnamed protein product [Didymodactylos carnosus]
MISPGTKFWFAISAACSWYVWRFMRNIGSPGSSTSTPSFFGGGSGVTDLNLSGSLAEYCKDVIIVIIFTQMISLLHVYLWWILLIIPLYAAYKLIKMFVYSPFGGLGGGSGGEGEQDQQKKSKRKIVRAVR